MLRVAVKFNRAAIIIRRKQRLSDSCKVDHGRKVFRHAGDAALRTKRERNDLLFFVTTTGRSAERQRSSHQLKPTTTRNAIIHVHAFGRTTEIVLDRFIETRSVDQLIEIVCDGMKFVLF